MHRTCLWIAVLLTACMVNGCGFGEAKSAAKQVAEAHLDARKADDMEKALSGYSDAFFKETPRDEWRTMMTGLQEKLGPVTSYECTSWHVNTGTGGTRVTLTYQVTCAKYPATETFVIAGGDPYTIMSHNINSKGLLQPGKPDTTVAPPLNN